MRSTINWLDSIMLRFLARSTSIGRNWLNWPPPCASLVCDRRWESTRETQEYRYNVMLAGKLSRDDLTRSWEVCSSCQLFGLWVRGECGVFNCSQVLRVFSHLSSSIPCNVIKRGPWDFRPFIFFCFVKLCSSIKSYVPKQYFRTL